jgi:adenylate cyclase
MKELLEQINQDVKNIFQYNIETTKAYAVPSRDDPSLTFPIGAIKSGKLIETCVLMIDIRNSTKISKQLKKDKIKQGKIYSAFVYAMASIADEYGFVRNIVGDRVMVVFQPSSCYVDAMNCAAAMYSVATRILKKHFAIEDFKVGIGIDFGEMLILKAGIRKHSKEQSEYKGLVWVGDAANTASKLCDFANKDYSSPIFRIKYEYIRPEQVLIGFKPVSLWILANNPNYKREPEYVTQYITNENSVALNAEEFASHVSVNTNPWKYDGCKVTSFNIERRTGSTSPILMSGKVFTEFKKAEPKSLYLSKLSQQDYPNKPETGSGIYGGYLIVPEINNIKI